MTLVFKLNLGYVIDTIVSGDKFVIHECQADRIADHYMWIEGKRHHRLGKNTSFFETRHEAELFAKARAGYYAATYTNAINSIINVVERYA